MNPSVLGSHDPKALISRIPSGITNVFPSGSSRPPKDNTLGCYPKAKTALLTWYHEFSKLEFRNFNELKSVYGNASIVANNRVIFNIKANDFRLVVSVNFRQLAAYVIWFGTHKEYDKIDIAKISFEIELLNFKK
jgi:mRNA interferase HigB